MNGIIHQCTHSDDDPNAVITEEAMFTAISAYIDHLFQVIQPQEVFFMAVDGVAPRAKMNQQRARRFKSAREAAERFEATKKKLKAGEVAEKPFDSNCITPGNRQGQRNRNRGRGRESEGEGEGSRKRERLSLAEPMGSLATHTGCLKT